MEDKKLTAKELKTIEQATEKLFALIEITGTFVLEQNEGILDIIMDTTGSTKDLALSQTRQLLVVLSGTSRKSAISRDLPYESYQRVFHISNGFI